jgi:hypothetical protein
VIGNAGAVCAERGGIVALLVDFYGIFWGFFFSICMKFEFAAEPVAQLRRANIASSFVGLRGVHNRSAYTCMTELGCWRHVAGECACLY